MDAYSGYNQILMYPLMMRAPPLSQIEAYITKYDALWLEKRRATCQRLVNKMFTNVIGKKIEVYLNDMLVKSLKMDNHMAHLNETFQIL